MHVTGPMPLDALTIRFVSWRMANAAWRDPTFAFSKVSWFEKCSLSHAIGGFGRVFCAWRSGFN